MDVFGYGRESRGHLQGNTCGLVVAGFVVVVAGAAVSLCFYKPFEEEGMGPLPIVAVASKFQVDDSSRAAQQQAGMLNRKSSC